MEKTRSYGIQSRNTAVWNHMTMYTLLTFSIFIPVVLGSMEKRPFQLVGKVSVGKWFPSPTPYWNANRPPPVPLTPPAPSGISSENAGRQSSPPPEDKNPSADALPPKADAPEPEKPPSPAPTPQIKEPSVPPLSPPSPPLSPPSPLLSPPSPPWSPPSPPEPPPSPPVSPPESTPIPLWNDSKRAGVVIAALAGLLQVVVVTFLLIKRRQMLAMAEYDVSNSDYSSHESA